MERLEEQCNTSVGAKDHAAVVSDCHSTFRLLKESNTFHDSSVHRLFHRLRSNMPAFCPLRMHFIPKANSTGSSQSRTDRKRPLSSPRRDGCAATNRLSSASRNECKPAVETVCSSAGEWDPESGAIRRGCRKRGANGQTFEVPSCGLYLSLGLQSGSILNGAVYGALSEGFRS